MGRKRLIHGFFWDLSLSSVSLPLSTAAYAGPALAGGPARRLPRVDVKCSIYGCYSMTDGLETPRKLCRFAELRPTLMSGDSKRGARLPVVLSVPGTAGLLGAMQGETWLMAALIYGGGLRVSECCQLRVKDVDFDQGLVFVRSGKGDKDRSTLLAEVGGRHCALDCGGRRRCIRQTVNQDWRRLDAGCTGPQVSERGP